MAEIANLKKSDLKVKIISDDVRYFLEVIGKGRKRLVPLNSFCVDLVNKRISYLEDIDKIHDIITRSIKSVKGRAQKHLERVRGGYLFFEITDPHSISRMFRRAKHRLGLKGFNFHSARHTFATYYINHKDSRVEDLRQILGHADLRTTEIYSKIKIDSISRDIEKFTDF